MNPKLIIAGALVFVWEQKRDFAKALAVPFILYCLLDFAHLLALDFPISLLLLPFALIIHTIFAVTTHRLILLGRGSVPEWGIRRWSKRESFFALHVVLVPVLFPASLLQLIPIIGVLIALVVYFWLVGRISLVFPGIAVDKGLTVRYSWKFTEKYQKEMVIVVAVFPIAIGIPIYGLSIIPYSTIGVTLLTTLVNIFTIAALSLAYREIGRLEFES